MRKNFTNAFLTNAYKKHRENILYDREKAWLPATQPMAERVRNEEQRVQRLQEVRSALHEVYKEYYNSNKTFTDDEKIVFQSRMRELQKQRGELIEIGLSYRYQESESEPEAQRKFVRQCPNNDCRGFLSTQWKCGLCEQWSCPECHELKGPTRDCEHVCDPNNVETAKLLAKDSKPCPNCQSMIFRIHGCDQMWCTQCNTGFDWKSGRKINSDSIHNPHYFEWQRTQPLRFNHTEPEPRQAHDCDRMIYASVARTLLEKAHRCYMGNHKIFRGYELKMVETHIRTIIENRDYELPTVVNQNELQRNPEQNEIRFNEQLRINYLNNKITEDQFKMLIQRNDKRRNRDKELKQVFHLQQMAYRDIIYNLIDSITPDEIEAEQCELYEEYEYNAFKNIYRVYEHSLAELSNQCNELFSDIAFTYNMSVVYSFSKHGTFMRHPIKTKKQKDAQANNICSKDALDEMVAYTDTY